MASNNTGQRRAPISAVLKDKLIDLFKSNGWTHTLPRTNVLLVAMIKDNNWSRAQVVRVFTIWKDTGGILTLSEERSLPERITSLEERCDSIEAIITAARKTEDISRTVEFLKVPNDSPLFQSYVWAPLREQIIHQIADLSVAKYNDLKDAATVLAQAEDTIIRSIISGNVWVFGTDLQLRSFFYQFATEFVIALQRSIVEPDVEATERDVIDDILANQVKDSLTPAVASELYYIAGYLLRALNEEGIRRQRTGAVFIAFTTNSRLDATAISNAMKDDSSPTSKIDRLNLGALVYPSDGFYQSMVSIERIYEALLTTENLVAFGPEAMTRIDAYITGHAVIRNRLGEGLSKHDAGKLAIVIDHLLANCVGKVPHSFGTRVHKSFEYLFNVMNSS
jgi:hypothetical protein